MESKAQTDRQKDGEKREAEKTDEETKKKGEKNGEKGWHRLIIIPQGVGSHGASRLETARK